MVSFTAGQTAESSTISYNEKQITSAKLTSTEASGSFDYYMKAVSNEIKPIHQWNFNNDLNDSVGTNNGTLKVDVSAYYPFNGNANDESDNSNDGTINGATLTTDRFGNSNKAYSFNDTDYMNTTSTIVLEEGKTISFWVKPRVFSNGYTDSSAYKNNYCPVAGIPSDNHDSCIDLRTQRIQIQDEAGNSYTSDEFTTPWDSNTWYHIVIVFNSTNTKFYANGLPLGDLAPFGVNTLSIERFGQAYSGPTNSEVDLDEIIIFDSDLTDNEVASLYELTSRHDLNDIYVDGKLNQAVELNMFGLMNNAPIYGTYIELDSAVSVSPTSNSLSWWYKTDSVRTAADGFHRLITTDENSQNGRIDLNTNTNKVVFESKTNNLFQNEYNTGIDMDDGDWHHYTLTFDSTSSKLYVDGQLADSTTQNTDTVNQTYGYIGAREEGVYTYGSGLNGELDDLRIYDTTLTALDVSTIYNSGNGKEVLDTYYEEVTNGVTHTFTNPGQDLKWKATENAGSTGEITKLKIEY